MKVEGLSEFEIVLLIELVMFGRWWSTTLERYQLGKDKLFQDGEIQPNIGPQGNQLIVKVWDLAAVSQHSSEVGRISHFQTGENFMLFENYSNLYSLFRCLTRSIINSLSAPKHQKANINCLTVNGNPKLSNNYFSLIL